MAEGDDDTPMDAQSQEIAKLLERMRKDPPPGQDPHLADQLLQCTLYLKSRVNPSEVGQHWFCSKASSLVIDTATFLLRLLAYTKAEEFKVSLSRVLLSCMDCVDGYQVAKFNANETYLSNVGLRSLVDYNINVTKWEASVVLPMLKTPTDDILSRAVHLVAANVGLTQHQELYQHLAQHVREAPFKDWPSKPPAGLFLLMADTNDQVRKWATAQAGLSSPLVGIHLKSPYAAVLTTILRRLQSSDQSAQSLQRPVAMPPHVPPINESNLMSSPDLWSTLPDMLRLYCTKDNIDTLNNLRGFSVSKTIFGHLSDNDAHFKHVLASFLWLLRGFGPALWNGHPLEYPQVMVDAIHDNQAFEAVMQEDPEKLVWYHEFLLSVWDAKVLEDSLPKIAAFMCETLQHSRYKPSFRAGVMMVFCSSLRELFKTARQDKSTKHLVALRSIIHMHCKTIVGVAFSRSYRDDDWILARQAARNVISDILLADSQDAHKRVRHLSILQNKPGLVTYGDLLPASFAAHDQLWDRMYETIPPDDGEAITVITHAVATFAHLDVLDERAYDLDGNPTKEVRHAFRVEAKIFNETLKQMRKGYKDVINNFTGSVGPEAIRKFLQANDTVKSLMMIMFSPATELQEAAQEVSMQAYDDIVGRDASFRAYIEHFPSQSFQGIFSYLRTVKIAITDFFEACAVSRSTVLCLTDILEVLCSRPGGLLYDSGWDTEIDLPENILELWNLMAETIALIYKHTPKWAHSIDAEDMIVWMRDALIFSRDMVAQYDVLQKAISGTLKISMTQASPRKGSGNGRDGGGRDGPTKVEAEMMGKMTEVIQEVLKWLKLTDLELLHQSVELVKMIFKSFEESQTTPPKDAVSRIKAMLIVVSEAEKKKAGAKHNLTQDQLATLANSVSPWLKESQMGIFARKTIVIDETDEEAEVSDDGIEYVGTTTRKSTAADQSSSSTKPVKDLNSVLMGSSYKPSTSTSSRAPQLNIWSKAAASSHARDMAKKKGTIASGHTSSKSKAMKEIREAHAARQQHLKGLQPAKPSLPRPSYAKSASSTAPSTASEKEESGEEGSSDEDSDDGEGGAKGLAGLTAMQKSPKKPKPRPTERRGIVVLDANVRNPAKERLDAREQARRTQMRLKPDLTPLHRLILSWDYNHAGDDPPTIPGMRPPLLRAVPDSFATHEEYRRTMEPLLTLECWSQVVKAKEESQPYTTWEISGKQYVDDWIDLDITAVDALPDRWYLTESDIVVLRNGNSPGRQGIMAKVQNFKQQGTGVLACVRCASVLADPGLLTKSRWEVSKVFSLNTVHREYAALMGLPFYDLFEMIMRPRPSKLQNIAPSRVQQAMVTYGLNEPQATAILGALETDGFALIQGPPGTGKTSTICGLAGAFLSNRSKAPTSIQAPGQNASTTKTPPKKLLICAPSNAAIDEVARRLKDGVRDSNGKLYSPNVVRIGNDANINISVKDISLDSLVAQKLDAQGTGNNGQNSAKVADLRRQLAQVTEERKAKLSVLQNIVNNTTQANNLDTEIKMLNSRRSALNHSLNQARDKAKDEGRAMDAARRKVRQEVLLDADIICSTLSGSGHESLEQFDFETVVIDEAAQSIELSSLIPLKYKCKRCIMVGDPQQLAPTVLSSRASNFNYQQSLFVRIQKHQPDAVHLLSIQYRMHPLISTLPSNVFYGGRLHDGPGMAEKTAQPWHRDPLFPPYRFFNVSQGQEESSGSHSLLNRSEAQAAVALYSRLRTQFSREGELDYRVGVVTMYRGQVLELKRQFIQRFQADIVNKVDFHTVDGFQGQEKDIIILSCVRAGPGLTSVGFLSDVRRMNVALTRSRSSLFILGHAATLERADETWKKIVQDARTRSCLVDNVTASTFTTASSSYMPAAPSTAKPKAAATATKPQQHVVPKDLHKPQDLKAVKPRPTLATSVSVPRAPSNAGPSRQTPPTPADAIKEEAVKQKTQDQEATTQPPASLHLQPAQRAPPKPAPPRPIGPPKPKAPSLFIPSKKPQKRPAESSAGPSNAKKRLTEEITRLQR